MGEHEYVPEGVEFVGEATTTDSGDPFHHGPWHRENTPGTRPESRGDIEDKPQSIMRFRRFSVKWEILQKAWGKGVSEWETDIL